MLKAQIVLELSTAQLVNLFQSKHFQNALGPFSSTVRAINYSEVADFLQVLIEFDDAEQDVYISRD